MWSPRAAAAVALADCIFHCCVGPAASLAAVTAARPRRHRRGLAVTLFPVAALAAAIRRSLRHLRRAAPQTTFRFRVAFCRKVARRIDEVEQGSVDDCAAGPSFTTQWLVITSHESFPSSLSLSSRAASFSRARSGWLRA